MIDSSSSPRFGQETPSLGDSGSSNSSELGKLTECMKSLKEKQLKMEQLDQSTRKTSTSTGMDDEDVSKEERKTLKIDLRSQQNKVSNNSEMFIFLTFYLSIQSILFNIELKVDENILDLLP